MAKTHEIDMTNGSIFKKILLYSLPLIFSGILQLLFNAADVVVVGKFSGSLSLAAVGSTSSLVNLLVNTVIGISVGANVLVARYYGAGEQREISRCVHSAMSLSILLGVLAGLAGFFFATPLLEWMDTDPEVLPLASLYLKIYFLGTPATVIYNFGAAILRAVGDTDRPLQYLLLSGVANVILNLITVIVFHMDVVGVAIATVTSQLISAFLVVRCLMSTEGAYQLIPTKLRFHWDMVGRIAAIGLPAGLQSALFSLSNMLIQSAVNSFGYVTMAGDSAGKSLSDFPYIAMNAFYHASMSFTSQNYGARKFDRIRKVWSSCLILATVVGILLGAAFCIFSRELLSLYISKAEPQREAILAVGQVRLLYLGLTYFLCGIMETLNGAQRGLGRSWTPLIISTLGSCVLRIIWVEVVFGCFRSLEVLYLSYAASWLLTSVAHGIALKIIARRQLKHPANSVL